MRGSASSKSMNRFFVTRALPTSSLLPVSFDAAWDYSYSEAPITLLSLSPSAIGASDWCDAHWLPYPTPPDSGQDGLRMNASLVII